MAGWEWARAEREHAAEAQAAWAIGLHGSVGALLGVECSRGEGVVPGPGSLSPLENGAVSVPRFTSSFAIHYFRGHGAHSPSS